MVFWTDLWAETITETEAYDRYKDRVRDKLNSLFEDTPPLGSGQSNRDEIPEASRLLLVEVLRDSSALERLWPTRWARTRNAALLWWLLLFGHRIGELLGVNVTDLHLMGSHPVVDIVRRQDSPHDPRPFSPSVKGLERTVKLPSQLLRPLTEWLEVRQGARSVSPQLFIGVSGQPLGRGSVDKLFARLGSLYPQLSGLSSHLLRHTFVAVARRVAAAGGDSEVATEWALANGLGWSDMASGKSYGRAQRAEAADELLWRVQSALAEGAPSLPIDVRGRRSNEQQ